MSDRVYKEWSASAYFQEVGLENYSKTSFLVQIKFITEDSEQTQTQTLIIN
jgi:hypothetical protein